MSSSSQKLTCLYSLPSTLHLVLAALDSVVDLLRHKCKCFADINPRSCGSFHVDQFMLFGKCFRFFNAHLTILTVVDEIQFTADEGEHRAVGFNVTFRFQKPERDVLERCVIADIVDEKNTNGVAWNFIDELMKVSWNLKINSR
jgi:hypothetical protein